MNHTEAAQYIKATLTAFGPDEAISMTKETWAKLRGAIKTLAEQPAQQEPVAWMRRDDYEDYLDESKVTSAIVYNYKLDIPLYTRPSQSEARELSQPAAPLTGLDVYLDPNDDLKPKRYPKPAAQWVGLTQQDINIAFDDTQEGGGFDDFARAIEAKLREKNAPQQSKEDA